MNEHTVKAFAEELEALSGSVAEMGGLVEAMIANALEAIQRRDTELGERTVTEDARVDRLELLIEQRVVRMLALRQPMGSDLRDTLTAFKISGELERIGDLAKNIAKRASVINRAQPLRVTQGLVRMGRQSLAQLKSALDSFSDRDAAAAAAVRAQDGEIDELYNSLFRELITYMMEDQRTIGLCAHLLFIAKNIERIGDHATNIGEAVHFMVTGDRLEDLRPKSDTTARDPLGLDEFANLPDED